MTVSRSRFLKEAIDSACNQYLSDIEIIIGDSTGVFDGHVDKRIREINTEGLVVTEALNVLIDEAKSDFILHLADDDIDLPNRASSTYDALQDCDIFCPSYKRMDENGKVYQDEIIGDWDYDKFLTGHLNMPIMSGGYRKSTTPRWDKRFPFLGDYLFHIQAHQMGCIHKTSKEFTTQMRYWSAQMCHHTNDDIRRREREEINNLFGVGLMR